MPITERGSVLVGSSTGRTPTRFSVRAAKGAAIGLGAAVGGGECTLGCTVQQQRLGEHGSARPTVSSAVADADVVAEAAQSLASVLEPGMNKQAERGRRRSGVKPMSDETRSKISAAQKLRYKHDPALKAAMRLKLVGKEPWNKGRTMSVETRAKMAAAKSGRSLRKGVRAKMSRAHMGKTHTEETVAKLSARLSGQPKSTAHRAAIAAAMRRRHAAARVLRAVEDVHRHQSLQFRGTGGGGGVAASAAAAAAAALDHPPAKGDASVPHADAGASERVNSHQHASGSGRGAPRATLAAGVSAAPHLGSDSARRLSKGQILSGYKAQLHEYRVLKDELAPWTQAFAEKHSRKPRISDVERTGVPWLVNKYKLYIMLRERLLMDTPHLRGSLSSARPGPEAVTDPAYRRQVIESRSMPAPINANTASGSTRDASARMGKALQYRAARGSLAAGSDDDGPAAVNNEAAARAADGGEFSDLLARMQAASAAGMTLETSNGRLTNGSNGAHEQSPTLADQQVSQPSNGAAKRPPSPAGRSPRALPSLPISAPQRVQSAMAAAQEYRQRRAAASSTGSTAAAAPAPTDSTANGKSKERLARILAAARSAKDKKMP